MKKRRFRTASWKAPPGTVGFAFLVMILAIAAIAYPWVMIWGDAEVAPASLDVGRSSGGLQSYISALRAESSLFWHLILRSALPKPLTMAGEAPTPRSSWADSLLMLLHRMQLTEPRTFLAMGVPSLRYTPHLESDTLILPANEPPIPPLVQVEEPAEDPALAAMGWRYTPQMLIYHTHNTEAFVPTSGATHIYNDHQSTIVRVGAHLAAELAALGVDVMHSDADHVKDNFANSYNESLRTVSATLQSRPSIEYVFDVHRDAVPRSATTVTLEGKSVARIYIVVGANQSLGHPNWQRNHDFAVRLNDKLNELYPGLSRGILVRDRSRFNQHVRDKALLIEIGGHQNSMEEAMLGASYLARAIAEVAKDLQHATP